MSTPRSSSSSVFQNPIIDVLDATKTDNIDVFRTLVPSKVPFDQQVSFFFNFRLMVFE